MNSISLSIFEPSAVSKSRFNVFLHKTDDLFSVPLSLRVNIDEYAEKLANSSFNFFLETESEDAAHAGLYINKEESKAYLSSIAVLPVFFGKGLGSKLLQEIECFLKKHNIRLIELEADLNSKKLRNFYTKAGFKITEDVGKFILLKEL